MKIVVEFYGVARRRTDVEEAIIELPGPTADVAELIEELAARWPVLAKECFDGKRLRREMTMNLDGDRFVTDPSEQLHDGQRVLLLSADGGG